MEGSHQVPQTVPCVLKQGSHRPFPPQVRRQKRLSKFVAKEELILCNRLPTGFGRVVGFEVELFETEENDSNCRLHADRSRRTGVDRFLNDLQFRLSGIEGVFGSLRIAGRVDQLDMRLLADLKQLRFDSNAVCSKDAR